MALASVETLIADIRAGKMVILMDDEDRENEGDLACWCALHAGTHQFYGTSRAWFDLLDPN